MAVLTFILRGIFFVISLIFMFAFVSVLFIVGTVFMLLSGRRPKFQIHKATSRPLNTDDLFRRPMKDVTPEKPQIY